MKGFIYSWLKINLRVVVLTLLLLVGFDLALIHLIIPYYMNAGNGKVNASADVDRGPLIRRLPADDQDTLTLWKQELAADKGFKVVFLGDSVIHGGGVPREDQTIPSYVAHHLQLLMSDRDLAVYCFSLPGCTPADTLNILQFIIDTRPELVIYDVNIGWFGSEKVMEHPRLAQLGKPVADGGPHTDESNRGTGLEQRLKRLATDHWALYRYRILLNYLWFGEPLKEKLALKVGGKETENRLTSPEELYKPWYEKDFSVLKETKGKLGYCTLNDSNQHWVSYLQLIEVLERNRIKTAFFMVPRNKTLYKKYDLLDETVLAEQQDKLASVARQSGIKVFDYTYAVGDRYFTDSVHLMAEGNQAVARTLTWDLVQSGLIRVGDS
ncbi:MAG: D-alanyl-lipoteichoic acid biosynthesis protein DltD [Bacillota bacterium]